MAAQQAAGGTDAGPEMTISEIEAHHPTGPARPDIATDGGAPFRGHAAAGQAASDDWLARPAVIIGMMVAVVTLILAVVSPRSPGAPPAREGGGHSVTEISQSPIMC
jgi:hypothetical protein